MKAKPTSSSSLPRRAPPRVLKSILVPIDFSPRSRQAAKYAGALAQKFGATLDLFFAVEPAPFYAGLEWTPLTIDSAELARTAQDRLRKLAATEVPEGVRVTALVGHGKAGARIVATARERHTDLIVISTHGYTGVERALMGSTAEEVIRQAPCAVLTLRPRTAPKSGLRIARILAPVDFSAPSREALAYAVAFARPLGAAVTAFHSLQPLAPPRRLAALAGRLEARAFAQARKNLAAWAERSAGGQTPPATEVGAGRARDEIIRVAGRLESDLVILATRGRSGLKRLLLGSVAENVVRHAPCPVLVVRAQKRVRPAARRKAEVTIMPFPP